MIGKITKFKLFSAITVLAIAEKAIALVVSSIHYKVGRLFALVNLLLNFLSFLIFRNSFDNIF